MNKGFTIPELLVALFAFSLIVGAGANLLLFGVVGQRSSLATQELLSQSSFVTEYVTRSLRQAQKDLDASCLSAVGLNYEISQPKESSQTGEAILFKNVLGQCQEFRLQGTRIEEAFWNGGAETSSAFLTSDDLAVTALRFLIQAESQADDLQPRATMYIEVEGQGAKAESRPTIQLQTTVSQRTVDVPK